MEFSQSPSYELVYKSTTAIKGVSSAQGLGKSMFQRERFLSTYLFVAAFAYAPSCLGSCISWLVLEKWMDQLRLVFIQRVSGKGELQMSSYKEMRYSYSSRACNSISGFEALIYLSSFQKTIHQTFFFTSIHSKNGPPNSLYLLPHAVPQAVLRPLPYMQCQIRNLVETFLCSSRRRQEAQSTGLAAYISDLQPLRLLLLSSLQKKKLSSPFVKFSKC